MKNFFLFLFFTGTLIWMPSGAQDLEKVAFEYFQGVESATRQHYDLWNMDLYGPMILIDPATRKVYASEPDSLGELTPTDSIFVGTFPKSINISGAWVEWSGKVWAMLPFPFPEGTSLTDGVGYLCHELFHRSQERLGFVFPNEELNDHLDSKEGRIYLRLELEALTRASGAMGGNEREKHLKNAFIFRNYRYETFPDSKRKENLLELNEGITQYTTAILRGRSREATVAYFKKVADLFLNGSTYVRTFAYHTTPVYGYLLRERKKYWNQEISMKTNLTDYFVKEFDIAMPENIKEAAAQVVNEYNGEAIIAAEEAREKKLFREKEKFIQTLITEPHLEIAIRRNNMSFDPSNVTPLEDLGAVYKGNVRWSDKWGILEVKSGLFLDNDGSRICVSFPIAVEGRNAKGDGWELWLNEGYKLVKKEDSVNYTIVEDE